MWPSPSPLLVQPRPAVFDYHLVASSLLKAKPGGAIKARVSIICFGAPGADDYYYDEPTPAGPVQVGPYCAGGRGGNFVRKTGINVSALSGLYIQAGAGSMAVRANDAAGAVLAVASNSSSTAGDVGDIKQLGGGGAGVSYPTAPGGTAAGAAYGAPAGASGQNYGGGGQGAVSGWGTSLSPGAPWIEIVWTF